ncbi:unnamed protein product [Urochloa humidicola]
MASIASQLQAIKSAIGAAPEPARRPITRPSVLFDAKEAADIDIRAILPIALSGLEHLASVDERFARYNSTLFRETSLEVNREQLTPKENEKLNKSISSYLRLLAGYLHLPSALKTLEYLIRRYMVHVYNLDELLLNALPYHDTHAFVRIVQLLNLGNSKWAFLDGVKSSGAPPPRSVLVQQCIRDKAVLETICNYATPTKEFSHSRTVICFCTAVIVECLGAVPKLDTDIVHRVLGFVFDSLNPEMTGDQDYKAGALMIVGVLATRATLAPKLVQNLIFFVARTAQHDAFESVDLPWLRVTAMAIISLVQSQSVHDFPKKALVILKDIRDFSGVLSVLSTEYNIDRFIRLYVESLVDYSTSDDSCHTHLMETIETLPMEKSVERIVSKVLGRCSKLSGATENPDINHTGVWAKKMLSAIEIKYPQELHDAIRKFLEKSEINSTGGDSVSEVFGLVFDESKKMPNEISDSNVWFSLDHPKATVRQSALSKIATSGIFNDSTLNPQKLINMQDAILRSLYDEDLSVVQAALSIEGLAAVASPDSLLKAYDDVLTKCIKIINKGGSKASKASDIAVSCLEKMVMEFQSHHLELVKDIAAIVFRLLIVHPKTHRVNLKALELAKKIQLEFYANSSLVYDEFSVQKMKQNLSADCIASINMKNIKAFAGTLLVNPSMHVEWLANSGNGTRVSRTLFLLIVLQTVVVPSEALDKQVSLCEACLPFLKDEWHHQHPEDNGAGDEISIDKLEKCSLELVKHIFNSDTEALDARILVCIFWGLLKVQSSYIKQNSMIGSGGNTMLDDLFLFFVASPGKNVFQKHLQYLIINCTGAPFQFISKYFLDEDLPDRVQVESLRVLASICSKCASAESSSLDESTCMQLVLGFPSVILLLAHENRDVRSSAVKCIEGLSLVWQRLSTSLPRNGNTIKLPQCMSSPTFGIFLESLVNQKAMISSDAKFVSAYISSMLSPHEDITVPKNLHERFDQPTKDALLDFILHSALKLSAYGKFMLLLALKGVGGILLQAENVKSLFFDLLDRRDQYHCRDRYKNEHDSKQHLSTHEMQILCLLLEVLFSMTDYAIIDFNMSEPLVRALKVDALAPDDPAVVMPCLTVLRTRSVFFNNLKTDTKEKVFGRLISLFQTENVEIRNATRDALLQIDVHASTVVKFIELIVACGGAKGRSKRTKRKDDLSHDASGSFEELFGEIPVASVLVSLLDILFLKKDVKQRPCLLKPLFQILSKLLSDQWVSGIACQYTNQHDTSSKTPDLSSSVKEAQHLILLVLKDIADTLHSSHQDALFSNSDVDLLIHYIRSVKDVGTRNHGFSLIASLGKACPQLVSESIVDLFVAVGDAIKQDDSHSQHVLEDLLSVLVPCWLSRTSSIEKLLQIFIKALADIPEHRRLTLMVYLLRTLGKESNLSTVIMHLLHSLVERISLSLSEHHGSHLSALSQEWEYGLAANVTDQYSYKLWFPCLSKLLKEIRVHDKQGRHLMLHLAMRLVLSKLQDTELIFELESDEAANFIQGSLGELMEEVVLCTVYTKDQKKDISGDILKELRDSASTILKTITGWMSASTYFRGITQLLDHSDNLVKRKTLGILSETARENSLVRNKQRKARKLKHSSVTAIKVDKRSGPYFSNLCLKILELIDRVVDSDTSVKIAAISSLETLAKEYPTDDPVYSKCLSTIINHIGSADVAASSGLIHTTGSLINVLGSKALPQLPLVLKNIMLIAHQVSCCPSGSYAHGSTRTDTKLSNQDTAILLSSLTTIEVIVEKLGEFVNPYLKEILDLVVLHPECSASLDAKLDAKAADVRKLLTEKVPVRLILPPLLDLYSAATICGEASISLAFQMLASLVSTMDRLAVGTYHAKIYEHCLAALDIRRQHPDSLKNINMVEQSIIHAIITLTMKLTEGTFRPLFLRTLEWAESEVDQSSSKKSLDRAIVFYKLINKLAEQHRSLFTPYFKYLLEGSVHYLLEDDALAGSKQKKKKAKLDVQVKQKDNLLGLKLWNLRALILKSLHKCFLYDNEQKILDSSNFQVLLKSIVSQFVVEPPESIESVVDAPPVEEVDEALVLCLGQMAVTARSDVLWKPLNHEVLMQTRSDKVRPKLLGLKVVRYMVQHLKEEYITLLPETTPFLGELLEDVELPVKTLSQEILKEMGTLSGEDLRQYL